MANKQTGQSNPRSFAGLFLFLATLVIYLITLSPVAYPGESARLIVLHLGLDPFPPQAHPLWGFFVKLIGALPISTVALRLNAFSALCGAAAVWLLYSITSSIQHNRTFEEVMASFSAPKAQAISGVVAALYLAVCIPFWIVSTRAHTASLDIFLLLLSLWLLLRFGATRRVSLLYASVLIYGLGVTELATMILLAPLYGIILVFYLWETASLKIGKILRMLLCFLLGLSPYFLGAWRFCQSPAYEWRSFTSYFQVLWYAWREQYLALSQGLPQVGWLTVMIVSFVPWLIVIGFRPRGRGITSRGAWFGTFILNGLLSALAIMVFLNTTISPWRIAQMRPLLVTPYVCIGMWAGYLAGYWYVILSKESRGRSSFLPNVKRIASRVYVPVLLAFLAFGAYRNFSTANGRTSRLAARYADEIVNSVGDRAWLITSGELDDNISIAAMEKGRSIRLLNTINGRSKAYLRYVASLFDSSRLKSLARVGMAPLLSEWFTEYPEVINQVAIVNAADLWYSGGMVPVPKKVLFLGAKDVKEVDVDALVREHKAFWDALKPMLAREVNRESPAQAWDRWIVAHAGKVANNLGVLLEDAGRDDVAFDAYREARAIDTNNVSALINMHALAKRTDRPEVSSIEADLNTLLNRLHTKLRLWSLSYHYGYVRYPEAYATRGWAWAMSGKPNLAINEMKRALELSGNSPEAQLALAAIYFTQDMPAESEKTYLEVLNEEPENARAMLGMARLAMKKGDIDSARSYLERLKELKAPVNAIRLEEAMCETLAGNPSAALGILSNVVRDEPDNMRAWAAMAIAATQLDDEKTIQTALAKLQSARVVSPSIRLTMAQLALNQDDRATARRHLEELMRVQPNNVPGLEMILRLDVYEFRRDDAEKHVEALLTVDPKNALGNYILGTLQVYNEQYSLAESSFRTSLAARRSPEVMNDLAWILQRRGAVDEALQLVQESLKLDDKNGPAWDTYGVLLMQRNRLDEAEKALQKALSMQPESAQIMLNIAKLYEKKGQYKDSMRTADLLLARPTELSREAYDELRELVKRLRANT